MSFICVNEFTDKIYKITFCYLFYGNLISFITNLHAHFYKFYVLINKPTKNQLTAKILKGQRCWTLMFIYISL